MKNLYILRHAKTNPVSTSGKDFDRELLPKGLQQLAELNKFFETYEFVRPVDTYVSSSKRTRQTFDAIKAVMTKTGKLQGAAFSENWYLADVKSLLSGLWNTNSREDVMLVGHNDGLSDMVSYFLEEDVILGTCEFVHLRFPALNWNETSKGLATLIHRYRPLKD